MAETAAESQIREVILYCMMELGEFEPHTREEAERRLDAEQAEQRMKREQAFDPCI